VQKVEIIQAEEFWNAVGKVSGIETKRHLGTDSKRGKEKLTGKSLEKKLKQIKPAKDAGGKQKK